MTQHDELFAAVGRLVSRGVRVAMTRIEWDPVRNKKRLAPGWEPSVGWHVGALPSEGEVRAAIHNGANAYLYRLPADVWAVDADSTDAVARVGAVLGAPVIHTPRGAHWLVRGTQPAVDDPAVDTAMRQLYGPGSFYDSPAGLQLYRGAVPDFAVIPPVPPQWITPHIVFPDKTLDQRSTTPVIPAGADPPADDFFAGPPTTPSRGRAMAAAKLAAIAHGPDEGADARSAIRDAALYLGGLLHAGWFSEAQAREQLLAACAARWGAADADDEKWIDQGLVDGDRPGRRLRIAAELPGTAVPGKDGGPAAGLRDRLYTPDELAARQPPEPLIEGLLDVASFAMVYGPGGSAKSFTVLDMACCVSLGLPWRGHAVKSGRVLFVAGEGASGMAKRVEAWRRSHGDQQPDIDVLHGALDLYGGAEMAELIELIAERSYCMVVFDTYNRCTPGLDENSPKDTGVVIRHIAAIQAAGATAVIVHHTPKDGGSPRGSAALVWATDHTLSVTKSQSSVTVVNERQKDHEDGQKIHLALVGDQATQSAYLVDSSPAANRGDLTVGAAGVAPEQAYDPFDVRPVGDELSAYAGPGQALVLPLAQMMAQRAVSTGAGVSRAEAAKLLGRMPGDGALRRAWDVLWQAGATTPATGSRTPVGRCWWVVPGDSRNSELARRLL